MPRGKKPAKATKRLPLARARAQAAMLEDQAQRERDVANMVGELSCSFAAADELAATCGLRSDAATVDLELVDAGETLWRRAAAEGHPLTLALKDLRSELERHRDAMLAFADRFDALLEAPPHDHVTPTPEDILRIRLAVLGPEPTGTPTRPTA